MKFYLKYICSAILIILICSAATAQKNQKTIYGLYAKNGWSDNLLKLDVKAFYIKGKTVWAAEGYKFIHSPKEGYILHKKDVKPSYSKRDDVDIVGETDDHIVTLACYGCAPKSGCTIQGKGTLAPYCSGCSGGDCTSDYTFFPKDDDSFMAVETPGGGY